MESLFVVGLVGDDQDAINSFISLKSAQDSSELIGTDALAPDKIVGAFLPRDDKAQVVTAVLEAEANILWLQIHLGPSPTPTRSTHHGHQAWTSVALHAASFKLCNLILYFTRQHPSDHSRLHFLRCVGDFKQRFLEETSTDRSGHKSKDSKKRALPVLTFVLECAIPSEKDFHTLLKQAVMTKYPNLARLDRECFSYHNPPALASRTSIDSILAGVYPHDSSSPTTLLRSIASSSTRLSEFVSETASQIRAKQATVSQKRRPPVPTNLGKWLDQWTGALASVLTSSSATQSTDGTNAPNNNSNQPSKSTPLAVTRAPAYRSRGLLAGCTFDVSKEHAEAAFPKVLSSYTDNLPPLQTLHEHLDRVNAALGVLRSTCSGPALPIWEQKLLGKCSEIWQRQPTPCEAMSVMGHRCVLPAHSTGTEIAGKSRGARAHEASGHLLVACACGQSQRRVSEAFSQAVANGVLSGVECCGDEWAFVPEGYRPPPQPHRSVRACRSRNFNANTSPAAAAAVHLTAVETLAVFVSRENSNCRFVSLAELSLAGVQGEPDVDREVVVEEVSQDDAKPTGRVLWLIEVPMGAERAQGWTVTFGGTFSDYDPTHGLTQPGFLEGSNQLTMVRTVKEGKSTKKRLLMYVGFEYECPAGHRFLAPLEARFNTTARLDEFASESLPLFVPCSPCDAPVPTRKGNNNSNQTTANNNKAAPAQLMRIHVVRAPGLDACSCYVLPSVSGSDGCDRVLEAPVPLVVSPSAMVCVRLPLVYAVVRGGADELAALRVSTASVFAVSQA